MDLLQNFDRIGYVYTGRIENKDTRSKKMEVRKGDIQDSTTGEHPGVGRYNRQKEKTTRHLLLKICTEETNPIQDHHALHSKGAGSY